MLRERHDPRRWGQRPASILLAMALIAVGALDISAASGAGGTSGGGAFVPARAYDLLANGGGGSVPRRTAIADIDGDGHPDLATASFATSFASIWWGDGTGRLAFGVADLFPPPYSYRKSGGIAVGDLDEDGDLDVVYTEMLGDRVYVMLNDGDRTFTLAPDGPVAVGGITPEDLIVADVDEDGDLDAVVTTHSDSIAVLLGDGSGRLAPAAWSPIPLIQGGMGLAAADLDGDGHLDLVQAEQTPSQVTVLLGDGDGRFTQAPGSPYASSGKPAKVKVGDLDGDGNHDIAVANQGGNVPVLMGDGSGRFTPAAGSPFSVGTDVGQMQTHDVAIADLDGDGRDELIAGTTPLLGREKSRVSVWSTSGPGTALEELPGGPIPLGFRSVHSVTPADLDRDGKIDLVLGQGDGDSYTLLARDALALRLDGDGGGTVAGLPDLDACGEACVGYAASGTTLTLTATADDRSDFAGWSGCDEQVGRDCTVTLDRDRVLTATFELERRSPSVRIATPEDGQEIAAGAPVAALFTCEDDDDGSGLDSCDGTVTDPDGTETALASGDPLPATLPGEYAVAVLATDRAGNTATASSHYRVVATPAPPPPPNGPRDVGVPAAPAGDQPAPPAPPAPPVSGSCEVNAVVLTGVRLRDGRATLSGVADRTLAGRVAVAYADGRPLARATVGGDGSISVHATLRSASASTRFRLAVAGRSSTAVRPRGKLVVTRRARGRDGTIRISGRLPRLDRRVLTVSARPLCARTGRVVGTAVVTPRGGVRLVLAAPADGSAPLVYRLRERSPSASVRGRSAAFPLVVRQAPATSG